MNHESRAGAKETKLGKETLSVKKNPQRVRSKAVSRKPKNELYLLRGEKLSDDLLNNVMDSLIAGTATESSESCK